MVGCFCLYYFICVKEWKTVFIFIRTERFHQALQNTVETLKPELTELSNSLGLTYNIRKVVFERFNSYLSMLYAYNIIYIHIFAYFFIRHICLCSFVFYANAYLNSFCKRCIQNLVLFCDY